jgi:hypothetical protein
VVDQQHTKITGYRDLSEAEIGLMNEIKTKEGDVAALFKRIYKVIGANGTNEGTRQAMLARSEFEMAFMRLVRAVAQPASPWGK